MNTKLVPDICYQTTETRDSCVEGLIFTLKRKGFSVSLFLLVANYTISAEQPKQDQARSRIQKGRRVKRQQKAK